MAIAVFGSINMDLVARTPRLPQAGETLTGSAFNTTPGGKGANQAVACAKLGVPTLMFGRVGDDVFGQTLREGLAGAGVEVDNVLVTPGISSGVAVIEVDERAENHIIIIPGANNTIDNSDLERLRQGLTRVKILLLQLEVPLEIVLAAARLARENWVTVLLDPAPARELPPELYTLADIITPNETEAGLLTGIKVDSVESAQKAATVLLERGAGRAIVKMGGRGAYWAGKEGGQFVPAFPIKAVDTVAAGDAFNGGLATALSEGLSFEEAVRRGMATGALSATRPGAQASLPERAELLDFLAKA